MSLYYKLYRRRHYVYLAAICASVMLVFLILNGEKPESGLNDDGGMPRPGADNGHDGGVKARSGVGTGGGDASRKKAKERINIHTYVEPEQCKGCPGENGAAVVLTVMLCL